MKSSTQKYNEIAYPSYKKRSPIHPINSDRPSKNKPTSDRLSISQNHYLNNLSYSA
ncbi:MAG: hypothetical protein ACK5VA_05925 [Pseudanabaena sp.]|nr:hypothetical protein [Pseudanabaena sp. M109S1SP2A07QC]MCE2886919.1 hypothetical protein [Pseudanabaena sp. 42896M_M3]